MRQSLLAVVFAACSLGPPETDDGIDTTDPLPTPTEETETSCAAVDADGDGVSACDDCGDDDPAVFPGAPERCDGRDTDCDGATEPDEVDGDGDGARDCQACDDAGYWSETRTLTGDALVAALHTLSADQVCTNYSLETTWMFTTLDKRSDGTVACVYTGRTTPVASSKPDATDMNTEHTWPQSLGAEYPPAECDLHHLFPTDSDANAARGNLPLDEVVSVDTWWDAPGESALGDAAGGARVFEPRDVHKGNAARALLYFAMRYGYTVSSDDVARYQAWHRLDPVDADELARTFAIRDRQGEANPFVACPALVERW